MALGISITRGYTFQPGVPYSTADLNAAALPNIVITGSVGASDIADGAITAVKVKPDAYWFVAAAGGPAAYTASLTPAATSLTTGLSIRLAFATANTGAATLNLNGLGVVEIRKYNRQPVVAGDLAANTIHELAYDGTYWVLQTPPGSPRRTYPTSTGTSPDYAVTIPDYTPAALADLKGWIFAFSAHASNTGAATLNINGLGAVSLMRHNGTAMSAGDIPINSPVIAVFDGSVFRALNVVAIATPPSAAISPVVNGADGTATALATGTKVGEATLTLPGGKTWKLVKVTFSTYLQSSAGIENFQLQNAGVAASGAVSTARGSYVTNNSDDATQVCHTWEWIPTGGLESGNLTLQVFADKTAGMTNGDQTANRRIVVVGYAQ